MVAQGGLRPYTQQGQDSAAAGMGARLPKEGLQGLGLTNEPDSHLSHSGLKVLEVGQALMQVLFSLALVLHQLERGQGDGHATQPPSWLKQPLLPALIITKSPSLSLGAGKGETPWGFVLEDGNKGSSRLWAQGCSRASGGFGCRAALIQAAP